MTRSFEDFSPEELKILGVSTPEELADFAANMDPQKIRSEAVDALLDIEEGLPEVVARARKYLAEYPDDSIMGLAGFYHESLIEVEGYEEEMDVNYLFSLLVIAIWRLAQAQEQVESLLDGSRRQGGEG